MRSRQKIGARAAIARTGGASRPGTVLVKSQRLKDVLVVAGEAGLLKGSRKRMMRGRMPEALVIRAKARTGIKKDTDLIEIALANLAVADDFPEWLLSQKRSVNKDLDLEF